jgi:hypothetical protein
MRVRIQSRSAALVLSALCVLPGCRREADPNKVPEVAEVKVEPGKIEVTPDEIKIKPGDIELERTFPLGKDDLGKTIYATGTVLGQVLPIGFFFKTKGDEVLFVRTANANVALGDTVQVLGPLQMVEAPMFEGWKVSALGRKVEAGWKMEDMWVIDARAVARMTRETTRPRAP